MGAGTTSAHSGWSVLLRQNIDKGGSAEMQGALVLDRESVVLGRSLRVLRVCQPVGLSVVLFCRGELSI